MNDSNHSPRKKFPLKWILVAVGVICLIVLVRLLPVNEVLESFNNWVKDLGPTGYFVFGIGYILATVLFLPGSVLTLGAGFIFGVIKGSIIVWVSATIGASLAFLVARYLLRSQIMEKFGKHSKFRAVDSAIGEKGGKIVLMLRLSPIFPFNMLNYLLGLTAVRFWHYVLASWIGMLPGTVLYVYLGYVGKASIEAASGGEGQTPWQLVYLMVGLLVTFVVTLYVTKIARKALKSSHLDATDEPKEEAVPRTGV